MGKISYTTDIWSSADRTSYMAVTAHWMAEKNGHLELRCALVAFNKVWGKHTAKNLARIMLAVTDRAGVTTNVSPFYLSNFSDSITDSIIEDGTRDYGQSPDKHQSHGGIGNSSP